MRIHYDTESYTVQSAENGMPLPSSLDVNKFTMAAYDNFDHNESTLSGISSSHDTVAVVFQEKDGAYRWKPNVSETNVVHGLKAFHLERDCQKLQFHKARNQATIAWWFQSNERPPGQTPLVWYEDERPNQGLVSARFKRVCGNETIPSKGSFLEWCECHLVQKTNPSLSGLIFASAALYFHLVLNSVHRIENPSRSVANSGAVKRIS